jgi:hypothetical protein
VEWVATQVYWIILLLGLLKAFVAFLLSLGSNNNFKEFLNENNLIVNERTSRLG